MKHLVAPLLGGALIFFGIHAVREMGVDPAIVILVVTILGYTIGLADGIATTLRAERRL